MRKTSLSHAIGYVLLVFFALPFQATGQNQTKKQTDFELNDKDRVVFLGNSLFESDQYGYLELVLTTRWADKNVTFRNLGWEGDNVFGQARSHFTNPPTPYETLMLQITEAKPSVIFIAYGGDEAQDGEKGVEKYKEGLTKLLDKTDELGAKAILLSPIPVLAGIPEEMLASRNKDLQLYAKVTADVAKERDKQFIDLYTPIANMSTQISLSEDGIHLNETGYFMLANIMEQSLGLPKSQQLIEIQVNKNTFNALLPATKYPSEPKEIKFTIDEPYLPIPLPEHEIPQNEQKKTIVISGLKKGYYTLFANEVPLTTASAKSWKAGIEIKQGGIFNQSERVKELINHKNQLHFQQYRPWNETYITGFRSYEQGRHKEGLADLNHIIFWLENQIDINKAPKQIIYHLVPVN